MNCFPVDSATNPTLAQSQSLASPPGTPAAASPAGYPATTEDGFLDELHGSTFPVFGFVRPDFTSPAVICVDPTSPNPTWEGILGHEIGHILTKWGHAPDSELHRLMVDGDLANRAYDHLDSKRFIYSGEEAKISN